MDVMVHEIPSNYDEYRQRLRTFIASNVPILERSPEGGGANAAISP